MKKSRIFQNLTIALLLGTLLYFAPSVLAAEIIREIRVEGNRRIEVATVISYIDLQKGDPFDQALLDRALKNLYATRLFADVSIRQHGSSLVVTVMENPIINEIRFEGNKKIKSEDLHGELQLKPRHVLTRTKVLADAERVQEIYRLSGRFSAVVDPKIIKMDQNRINLIFEISEGPETLISRISFIGNKRYSDGRLKKVIRSREDRWYRFWTSDDKYDPDRLAYDQELLRKFYLENGYADFRVDTAIAELSPDRKDFLVTFSVEEGNRYKIGKVNVISKIPDLKASLVKDTVAFKSGDWYKVGKIEDTITKMTNRLGNFQFAFVDVRPSITRNRSARTIDIIFTINDGQKTFIENINISGNTRTLDEVIRREMKLIEGDPFNAAKIRKSEQQIRNLGFFDRVEVRPRSGSSPNKTNINVKVEERSTGELSVGAGYSTTDGPLADFKIKERNFLGKGQELQLSSMIASKKTEFNFSFTEPYFLKRDLSAGIDLFHVMRDLQDQSSYNSRRSGGGLRLGYPMSERWRQNLNYRYERNKITDVLATASLYIQQQEGERDTSAIAQTLTYDTRDSKLSPTEGFVGRINTEVAGLGGEARYYKARVKGTYYYPVADKWTLSILGEIGYIHGWGDETVRINERFYIGGDNLRGFADSGIGPRDSVSDDSLGGNRFWRGSVELAFPTGLPEDLGIRAHVFSDLGDLWTLDDSGATIQDVSSVRMSAGFGISWRSPLGPVRVDLAKPIMRESFDKVQQFRLSFGTRF
ncbi:MAG: outer membrane protein assembly factor BamA [Alphaproteobacteria bacterium]|nr:outer membrane protein assembly factor BamA [Alphaproteobacteria bacterium]